MPAHNAEAEYEDYLFEEAKEQAKLDRHNARHKIVISGHEANIIMNFPNPYKVDSHAWKEMQALKLKFHDLYFRGEWEELQGNFLQL